MKGEKGGGEKVQENTKKGAIWLGKWLSTLCLSWFSYQSSLCGILNFPCYHTPAALQWEEEEEEELLQQRVEASSKFPHDHNP